MRPDRPHQTKALQLVREAFAAGKRAPLIQMPTGAGKTHVGSRCADMAIRQGKSVLWLAHRDELVHQPKDRLLADGWGAERLCIIQAGRTSGLAASPLTIASIQTLLARAARGAELPAADVVIFDEARHYVAKDWHGRVASRYAASRRIGLDATPERPDGAPLKDLFDCMLVPTSVAELTAAGYLVPSVIVAPNDYQEDLAQDPVEAYFEHIPGQRTIVFASTVPAARDIAARLRDAGVSAECVDAKTPDDVRAGAMRRFASGETRVITNVRILTEGTDLPPCEAVMHAGKAGSLPDWVQKGGRGLRPSPATGKRQCTIVDLFGCMHLFGFLDDPQVFSLEGQAMALAEGLPPVAQCPKCSAWGRSCARCARCGFTLPEVGPRAPRIRAADMIEQRKATDGDGVRQERLARWALELRRQGVTGKGLWKIAHRYKGTYGAPPLETWIVGALSESKRVIEAEKAARAKAADPLFANLGGVE